MFFFYSRSRARKYIGNNMRTRNKAPAFQDLHNVVGIQTMSSNNQGCTKLGSLFIHTNKCGVCVCVDKHTYTQKRLH